MTIKKNVYDANEAIECTPVNYIPSHYNEKPDLISNELLKIANLISVTSDKTGMPQDEIFLQLSKHGKLLRDAINIKAEIRGLTYQLNSIIDQISTNII